MIDYNIIAGHFDQTRKYVWDDLKPFLHKIKPQSRVLDLGCGNGRVLTELKDKNISYLGIDRSSALIAFAKKNYPEQHFLLGDITKNRTFAELKNYDCVLLFAVLHHILARKEQKQLFQNIAGVLKKNGYLFLTTWNMHQIKYKTKISKNNIVTIPYCLSDGKKVVKKEYRQIKAFRPKEIEALANSAGLTVKNYYFSAKGRQTNEKNGQNLCFEMEKIV